MSERLVVKIGNANAVEAVMAVLPGQSQPEQVFRPAPGERVTTIQLEPGLNTVQQVQTVIRFLGEMMNPTARPWWIECDDEMLRTMLCEHYGISVEVTRPPMWGDGSTTANAKKNAIEAGGQ